MTTDQLTAGTRIAFRHTRTGKDSTGTITRVWIADDGRVFYSVRISSRSHEMIDARDVLHTR